MRILLDQRDERLEATLAKRAPTVEDVGLSWEISARWLISLEPLDASRMALPLGGQWDGLG